MSLINKADEPLLFNKISINLFFISSDTSIIKNKEHKIFLIIIFSLFSIFEIIDNNHTGILCPLDIKKFAVTIEKMIQKPQELEKIKKSVQQINFLKQNYENINMLEKFL